MNPLSSHPTEQLSSLLTLGESSGLFPIKRAPSGLQGVVPGKANKWKAHLTHHGKYITLGVFINKHDAHAAYLKAKRELHAHCTI